MKIVELGQGEDILRVVIHASDGQPIAEHWLHAVKGSLAYFKGGAGPGPFPSAAPEAARQAKPDLQRSTK